MPIPQVIKEEDRHICRYCRFYMRAERYCCQNKTDEIRPDETCFYWEKRLNGQMNL